MLSRHLSCRYAVEFRKEIGTVIPSLIALLNSHSRYIRSDMVSALVKLADHGEFVVVQYSGVADAC